ncbi:MAG: hypothetical protein ACU0GG_16370 [Paracoccaceae bacterium]
MKVHVIRDVNSREINKALIKKHTEELIRAMGFAKACEVTGKSKAVLGRYASMDPEHENRFIPVDALLELELAAGQPLLTCALYKMQMRCPECC